MVIEVRKISPRITNVTEATSVEFASLIGELQEKRDFSKIEGHFSIYRSIKGRIVIDLDMAEEKK